MRTNNQELIEVVNNLQERNENLRMNEEAGTAEELVLSL